MIPPTGGPLLTRRSASIAALCLGLGLGRGAGAAATSPPGWTAFLAEFRASATRQGIKPELFDQAFASMTPDPSVAGLVRRQPEFNRPLGAYLAQQVTPARIERGRRLERQWAGALAASQARYGVPAAITVAVWGLESNFGAAAGDKDIIRCLATLASIGYRPDLYRAELLAALRLLQSGAVPRQSLRGSWAGAMGQPQFMPSSYDSYGADGDGDGRSDIWTSVPDVVASIGRFLQAKGWDAALGWGFEVALPTGFDLRESHATYADWISRGLTRTDGGPMPQTGTATLFFPAGAAGPAFLVTPNYEVIKTYNFSDAYVLSVSHLADRIEGGAAFRAVWPTDAPMSRDSRIALQARLVDLGYPVDNREGRISLALRDTIRAAQMSVGLVPDGHPTDALLAALDSPSTPHR